MGAFKRILTVLHEEPETWLAYLRGQKLEELAHLKAAKPRFRGELLRLAIFFYRLLGRVIGV